MKTKIIIYGAVIAALLIIVGMVILVSSIKFDTTLEFRVIDFVSKNWVWDFTAKLQDRFIQGYYQSNTGPIVFQFTGLQPGEWTLELDAPYYESVRLPVTIKSGRNTINEPVEMIGYEIPGLTELFVYKERGDGELILNPRPINAEGMGIATHPCLDMWFGLRISVQEKNGIIVQEPVEKGSNRGEELFRGSCEWEWDPNLDTFYRYRVKVPVGRIKKHNAPFRVYDYIIVLIDSRKIDKQELTSEMEKVFSFTDEAEAKLFLDSYADKITYFISTDWNQPAL